MTPWRTAETLAQLSRIPQAWRVAVVSPHLDDAVLSIGATISALTRRGVEVTVHTVFAGSPTPNGQPVDRSHLRAGFATPAEAAVHRRLEDQRACALLGATPRWLDLSDGEQLARDVDDIARQLAPHLSENDLVLAPGHPVVHPDHLAVTMAVRSLRRPGAHLATYLEQPYATWQQFNRGTLRARTAQRAWAAYEDDDGVEMTFLRPDTQAADHLRKLHAMSCYRSQLRVLRALPRTRIMGFELLNGGETIAWPREVATLLACAPRSRALRGSTTGKDGAQTC